MRISDWSSDVCSSDLPEAEICTGNVFYSTPALTNRAKLSSNGLILAESEEGSRTQWPSTSKCPHFHRPWRKGRLQSGSSKRAIPSPLATCWRKSRPIRRRWNLRRLTKAPLESEERRVGKEWVSKCRSRWASVHENKKR